MQLAVLRPLLPRGVQSSGLSLPGFEAVQHFRKHHIRDRNRKRTEFRSNDVRSSHFHSNRGRNGSRYSSDANQHVLRSWNLHCWLAQQMPLQSEAAPASLLPKRL